MIELTDKAAAEAFTKKWAYEPHRPGYAKRTPVIRHHSPYQGQPQCQAETSKAMGNWTQFAQCCNRGKVTLADGSTWCGTHSPEAVRKRGAKQAARWAETQAKWAKERADREAKIALETAFPKLRDALQQIADGHNDPRTLAAQVLAEWAPKEKTDGEA